jgi:hypothetical protein
LDLDSGRPSAYFLQAKKKETVVRYRRDRLRLALGVVAIVLIAIARAGAHHSFAPYETTLQIKLTGVVSDYKWANPHVYFEIDAPDATTGQTRHWLIECASTSILNRAGWKFNMLKPGDKVTIVVSPLRNGEPAALLKQITLADGRKLSNGAAAGRATIE